MKNISGASIDDKCGRRLLLRALTLPGEGFVSEGRAEATLLGLRWDICGYPSGGRKVNLGGIITACTEGQAVQCVTAGDRQPPPV